MSGTGLTLSGSRIQNATQVNQAAEDVNVTGWATGDDLIYAVSFSNLAMGGTVETAVEIRWRNKTDAGTFAALAGTGELIWSTATDLLDDDPVTGTESVCTGTGIYSDGFMHEDTNSGTVAVGGGDWSENQYAVSPTGALGGKEYEFELYDVDAGASVGTMLATLTIASSGTTITANTQALLIAEGTADIVIANTVTAITQALLLAEGTATIDYGVLIQANTQALILAENTADIVFDTIVETNSQALVISAETADIVFDVSITAITQALVLSEGLADIVVTTDVVVNANSQALVLAEGTADIVFDVTITAITQALVLAEGLATIVVGSNAVIDANSQALVLAEGTADIVYDVTITANTQALLLAEGTADIVLDVTVTAITQALTLAENTATIVVDTIVNTNSQALILAEGVAGIAVGSNVVVVAVTQALVLAEGVAGIVYDVVVQGITQALVLSEGTATITTDVATVVDANSQALVLAEGVATITFDVAINAVTQALTLTAYVASITVGGTSTTYHIIAGNQMIAISADTSFPLDLAVDDSGGVVGLTITCSLRDPSNSTFYLDFNDGTFKASGWVTKAQTLTEYGSGFYGTNLDVAGIINFPAVKHAVVEYSVTGSVIAISTTILSVARTWDEARALTVGKYLGLS